MVGGALAPLHPPSLASQQSGPSELSTIGALFIDNEAKCAARGKWGFGYWETQSKNILPQHALRHCFDFTKTLAVCPWRLQRDRKLLHKHKMKLVPDVVSHSTLLTNISKIRKLEAFVRDRFRGGLQNYIN